MKELKSHPAASLFPIMSHSEYAALKADISENGVREAVWITEDGEMLDGRHRYGACFELGIECPTRVWKGNEKDAARFVVSLNLKRRHLNAGQLSMVASRLATLQKGWQPRNPPIGGIGQAEAAEALGVSVRSEQRADVVIEKGSEELVKAVDSGEVAVSVAAEIAATTPKRSQMKAVRERKEKPPKEDKPKAEPKPKKVKAATVAKAEYDKLIAEHAELLKEFERADSEIRSLQLLVESLQKTDLAKEVAKWHLNFDQLEGRLRQCMTTQAEAVKQAAWSTNLLEKIRKALNVEQNKQILPAIQSK